MGKIVVPKQTTKDQASPSLRSSDVDTGTLSTEVTHEPSLLYHERSLFYYASKRLIDVVLAMLGIIVLMPVFLIIALCIHFDDGGDILYFRELVGLRGQRFFALKFRTMLPNADAYLENHPELKRKYLQNMKLNPDPRVTRVGRFLRKTSLDELPQLFNVLVGQMSLVGPRGIHQSELARYGKYAQKRLSVKPGITGPWQINARRHDSYAERIPLDMYYIDNRSCILDLVILLKTLKVFIIHTGV